MMEALFLVVWTLFFLFAGYGCMRWLETHLKVYLLIIINCLYLGGIFMLFPMIG
jgi:hypothetical protein